MWPITFDSCFSTYVHALCIHLLMHTCMHTYMHTKIYTYLHTYITHNIHACLHRTTTKYAHTAYIYYIYTYPKLHHFADLDPHPLLLPLDLTPPWQASSVSNPTPEPSSAVRGSGANGGGGGGRLKSCLSSRKRARGAAASTSGSDRTGTSLASPDTPSVAVAPGGTEKLGQGHNSPAAGIVGEVKTPGPVAAGSAGNVSALDMSLETPRRVVFGAPSAAEFNHLSPSNRLTPMPSRDAKVSVVGACFVPRGAVWGVPFVSLAVF